MEYVTEIRKLSGGRYLVSLESGLQFPLYRNELSGFDIRESGEVSEAVMLQIQTELLPKRARLRAMHLLEKKDYTEAQLRRKLREDYYPEMIIDDSLAYVKSFHYIDDLRYARSYFESRSSVKSIRQIEQELYAKGVDRETVRQAALETELPDEESQILSLLEKKQYDLSCTDPKEQQRIYRFLVRRGYSTSAVLHVLHCMGE